MSNSNTDSAQDLFRSAQDALLGVFRWGTERSSEAAAQGVADRILKSQEQAIQMMSAMSGLWAEMAKAQVAGPEGVRAYMEKFQREVPLMGSALPSADALQKAAEMWRESGKRFVEAMMPMSQSFGLGSAIGEGMPDGFREMFGGFAKSPGFGLTREYQAKLGQAFDAWLEYQERDVEYRKLLSKAWTDSFAAVMQAMADRATKGEAPKTPREMMQLWIDVADDTFIALFRTDAFSRTQSGLMNAMMKLRKTRRKIMEDALIASDLPTRSQLDEAHRMIYQLRKELKAVKRELKEIKRVRAVKRDLPVSEPTTTSVPSDEARGAHHGG